MPLFDAETRSRLALEAAGLGSWAWDVKSGAVECDNRAAAIWGLPPGRARTMAEIDAVVHPDDRVARSAALARALELGGDGNFMVEYRVVRRSDGATRHVASRGRVRFENGTPIRMIGINCDMTEHRRSDVAVRHSEARLAGIVSIAAEAIISIDAHGDVTLFNQGAEAIFGWSGTEIIGKPLDLLIPEHVRAAHRGHLQGFAASGVSSRRMGERRAIQGLRKDGTVFPAEASISQIDIDGEKTFTVVLRDVTERRQRQEQLERGVAERTAELSALLDAVPDGITSTDMERRIVNPNAAMSRLFGYVRGELVGMHARHLFASEADDTAIAHAWQQWEQEGAIMPVTVSCRRKDGSTFTALVHGTVVRDAGGAPLGRVGIIRDITEEQTRQKALLQAQRMEAFGQLTGGIAHDFNNLLTVITGNQELLAMRLKDPRDLVLLQRSQEAAEMGARLTARLLTFARRRRLEPTLIDLNEQLSGMAELLRRAIGEQITLATDFAPLLGQVRADPSEIENAILNLVINSRDAMPGGGSILIETSSHVVEADERCDTGLPPGTYVRLSVSDTGGGMPPEVVSRAFEPFFTTKAAGKGTGLGLSTIYGFVKELGGTVTIYSEVGRGTTVNLYLPRADGADAARAASTGAADVPSAAGETVLLVEDDEAVRTVARERLYQLGYRVLEADSGPAAVHVLQEATDRIDIVFSDVVMPGGMSGYDLARWVGEHAPAIKMVLTSGYPDEMARAQGAALRAIRLLRKPYSRAELARALRDSLSG